MGTTPSAEQKPPEAGATTDYVDKTFSGQISVEVTSTELIRISEEAGKVILKIYEGEKESWGVEQKSDDSPLTRADQEANEHICNELERLYPHIPIVTEERKIISYDIRKKYKYHFLVDPLDGTKEFIKRNGQFTVNIALIEGQTPCMGVVHTPCAGTTHWAVKGQGAFVRFQGADRGLNVAEFDPITPGLTLVGSASHSSQETTEFVSQFKDPTFKALGSSLKLLLVAEGLAHVYPRLAPTSEWDTAAAHIVVTEAGGHVLQAGKCDNKGKALENWREALALEQPVLYGKEDMLNPFFVVLGKMIAVEKISSGAVPAAPADEAK